MKAVEESIKGLTNKEKIEIMKSKDFVLDLYRWQSLNSWLADLGLFDEEAARNEFELILRKHFKK